MYRQKFGKQPTVLCSLKLHDVDAVELQKRDILERCQNFLAFHSAMNLSLDKLRLQIQIDS